MLVVPWSTTIARRDTRAGVRDQTALPSTTTHLRAIGLGEVKYLLGTVRSTSIGGTLVTYCMLPRDSRNGPLRTCLSTIAGSRMGAGQAGLLYLLDLRA